MALSDNYPFVGYAIQCRRASRATKGKSVDFSDLSTLTSVQRLQDRTLAGSLSVSPQVLYLRMMF